MFNVDFVCRNKISSFSILDLFVLSEVLVVCPRVIFMVSELATPQTRREIKDLKKTSRIDNGLHFCKIQVEIYLIKGNSELLKGLLAV